MTSETELPTQLREHYAAQGRLSKKAKDIGEAYYRAWLERRESDAEKHEGEYIAINCEEPDAPQFKKFEAHTIGHGLSVARRAFKKEFGAALCWVRPIEA